MKKQTNNFKETMPDELKLSRTAISAAKKPTYIYTDEDLGEGILEAGISY